MTGIETALLRVNVAITILLLLTAIFRFARGDLETGVEGLIAGAVLALMLAIVNKVRQESL